MSSKENKPIAVGDLCVVVAPDGYGLKRGSYKLITELHPGKDYRKSYARVTSPDHGFKAFWHHTSRLTTIVHGPDFFR